IDRRAGVGAHDRHDPPLVMAAGDALVAVEDLEALCRQKVQRAMHHAARNRNDVAGAGARMPTRSLVEGKLPAVQASADSFTRPPTRPPPLPPPAPPPAPPRPRPTPRPPLWGARGANPPPRPPATPAPPRHSP